MKLVKKLIYSSLFLGLILLLQTFEQEDTNLDLQAYKADVCDSTLEISQSDRDSADSILSSLYDTNIRADVTTAVNDQTAGLDLVMNLLKYLIPWLVFLIISLIGWIFYCCYCCCDKKCPPSQCCKRDYEKNQLSKMEFYVPIGFAIVLNLLLFSASIAGLSYAGDVGRGMKAARCGLISVFYDVIYPQEGGTSNFPGLSGLKTNMDSIASQLGDFQNKLKTTFSGKTSASIKTQKQDVVDANNNMKRGASNAAVPVNDGGTETYLSSNNFVDFILADSADANFNTYSSNYKALGAEYSKYLVCTPQPQEIAAYYDGMVTTCESLEEQANNIAGPGFDTGAIDSGSSTINNFITTIEDSGTTLYDNTKILSTSGDYATLALNVLFGIGLGLSIISIISIILMLLLKLYKLRGLLHFAWCIYVIIMILCFLLAALLHPSSVMFAEVCHYLNDFYTNQTFFEETKFVSDADTKNIIASCFFPGSSKSLYEVMNLDSATAPLNDFTAQINAFQTQLSSMDSLKATFQQHLDGNLAAFQNAKDGAVFDLKPADYATYQAAVNKFNSFKSNSGCVELAGQTCSDGKLPMKSASDTDTAKYNTKCWHPAYLATSSPSCADQSSLAETTTLKAQYSKQSTLWANALSKEQNVLTLNAKAQKTFEDYIANINSFITDVNKIITDLDNLLKGVDCSFLSSSFAYLLDGLCVIFVPGVSRTTVLIIIIGVSMFFGSLANCCVGLRAYRIQTYSFKGENSSKIAPKDVEETQGFHPQ